ncbi:MAG: hypothetical protein KGY41_08340, partial [Desulfovermiculus sp.]|nr:hypothetical protein [Desulfovermiculus sp.]
MSQKKNPPLAPPSRLEDRREGGESEEERFRADTGQCKYDAVLATGTLFFFVPREDPGNVFSCGS